MSVEELNRVHRRYIQVSNSFKSAWTFHQFIQGLRKVFIEDGPPDYAADFQTVYNELKEVSKNLSEVTVDHARGQLDAVEEGLTPLVEALLAADERVSPGLLRQFFQRVKNYDDNILSQLVKFYLYFRGDGGWNADRLDKADYLSTKVCEEYQDSGDAFVLRDRTHVREMAQGFWAALGSEAEGEEEVKDLVRALEAMRREIAESASIDQLHDHQLVQRYRELKHGLGDRFFQPQVLAAIVETNLVLKNHVQKLYRRDEERIIAEYQQVFDLERETPVDVDMRGELADFREAVERFEQQLQGGENVRLHDVAALRERVRVLLPRLQPGEVAAPEPTPPPPEVRELLADLAAAAGPPEAAAEPEEEYVAEQLSAVIAVLDDTNRSLDPRKAVLQPEVFALGIEAREVVAYRRLFGQGECDRQREKLILRGAAVRARIEEDVDRIRSILDDSSVSRDTPAFVAARKTVRYADLVLRRLEHLIEVAVLDADAAEARSLQRLKMKLRRSHAGLWLLVHKD